MGLLTPDSGQPDRDLLLAIATGVAEYWNEFGGIENGFRLVVGEAELAACCARGQQIFEETFPEPSPFKRVAALLVLGRLYPFFGLSKVNSEDFQEANLSTESHNQWIARVMALMIKPTLAALEINLGHAGRDNWVSLNKWNGYPSPHFKMEFIEFLQWLDNHGWPQVDQEWDETLIYRVGRMIRATALIIENCYYCSETPLPAPTPNDLRGNCKRCLHDRDLTSVTYDVVIYENYMQAQTAQIANIV